MGEKQKKAGNAGVAPKLISCRVCGAIMVRLSRDVCSDCFRQEEALFSKVRDHLARSPGISVKDLAREVGTTVEQIDIFITSGRLERIGAQIAHQCQTCSTVIMTGLICQDCLKSIKEHVSDLQAGKRRKESGKTTPE